ncbi:MAG: rod shape-determining protein MreD [Anaerolineales bacterium]|nr:rod shape-determining protein MreD [Anaerolineales bacterium]
MAYLIGIPILAILAILQSVVFNDIKLLDGRTDLILLAVVTWGIVGRPREALVWALVGGLFLDLLSGVPLGTTSIILIVITFLVSFSEGRFWESHFLMPMGVILAASLLYYVLSMAIIWIIGHELDFNMTLFRIILPSTFLNLLLILPATQLARSLRQSLYPPEVSI